MLLLALLTLFPCLLVNSFSARPGDVVGREIIASQRLFITPLSLLENENDVLIGEETLSSIDDTFISKSLLARKNELHDGLGKRYVARTQKGFLNVHSAPGDPYATDNIVGQLQEGQIVTSVNRRTGWIEHDAGGWSIAKFGGFTWLEPLED